MEQLRKRREEDDETNGPNRRDATQSRGGPETDVTKENGSWTEFSGNTLKLLTKKWDVHSSV